VEEPHPLFSFNQSLFASIILFFFFSSGQVLNNKNGAGSCY